MPFVCYFRRGHYFIFMYYFLCIIVLCSQIKGILLSLSPLYLPVLSAPVYFICRQTDIAAVQPLI